MRKRLAGIVAAVALVIGGPALADGMPGGPGRYNAPYSFNWSGIYAGSDIGWMGSDFSGHSVTTPTRGFGTSLDTAIGGFHVGVQHQFGNIVLGVEGAVKAGLDDRFGDTPGTGTAGTTCGTTTAFACEARINDILQVGPRLGWAMHNWLLYGTGGYARADLASQARTIATGAIVSKVSNDHNGWFLGGGLEYGIAPSIIVGVEYTHYEFNSEAHNDAVTPVNSRTLSASSDAVVGRLSFKLGRDEPRVPLK
jgi:outer membrane immunogenic protein